MERNLNEEYPYGKFPTKYTKNGQQKYFEELTSSVHEIQVDTLSAPQPIQNQDSQYNQNNSFDISKLLPLIKMMSGKKNMSNNDILQMMIPLLGGGNASQISDIMQLFNKEQPSEEIVEDLEKSSTMNIDDYKKVE